MNIDWMSFLTGVFATMIVIDLVFTSMIIFMERYTRK